MVRADNVLFDTHLEKGLVAARGGDREDLGSALFAGPRRISSYRRRSGHASDIRQILDSPQELAQDGEVKGRPSGLVMPDDRRNFGGKYETKTYRIAPGRGLSHWSVSRVGTWFCICANWADRLRIELDDQRQRVHRSKQPDIDDDHYRGRHRLL